MFTDKERLYLIQLLNETKIEVIEDIKAGCLAHDELKLINDVLRKLKS
jgi:hypothetical protein